MAGDQLDGHGGGGGGDGVGDGSGGARLVVTQLLGGATVCHIDVVTTATTITTIVVPEVKMMECQCYFTI